MCCYATRWYCVYERLASGRDWWKLFAVENTDGNVSFHLNVFSTGNTTEEVYELGPVLELKPFALGGMNMDVETSREWLG